MHSISERVLKRSAASVLLAWAVLLSASWVRAQPVDDATRAAARSLGEAGIDYYDKGQYEEALAAFDRAEAMVPAPTLSLRAARCLEKLGRLVEASERYLKTTALTIDPALPETYRETQQQAQLEAANARRDLLPRIPTVEIVVEGPVDEVRVDRRTVPLAALGVPRPLDPGEHVLWAGRGVATATSTLRLAEGERQRVVLQLAEVATSSHKEPAPSAPPPPASPVLRDLSWMGLVAGGAALSTGLVTWGLARSKVEDIDTFCPERSCPYDTLTSKQRDELDAYSTLRDVSMFGLIGGSVLIAAGGVGLWVTAEPPTPAGVVAVGITPAGAGIAGCF